MMLYRRTLLLFILISGMFYWHCSRVPITGRRQMNLLPEYMLMDMSLTNYNQFLKENKNIPGTADAAMVKRVGNKLAEASEDYMNRNGHADRIKDYKWEFNLIQNKLVNAWCMPGGKVVVYTGLLPVSQTETGLAVVMGHEIAHAIARHGNERMSQQILIQMGGVALSVALSEKPEQTRNIFMASYGIGSTVGLSLPFSRAHEAESDMMGLIFMAMAGYNPEEAISFWERMAAAKSGSPPELLSTHPGDATRIRKIKEFMPEAMKFYNPR